MTHCTSCLAQGGLGVGGRSCLQPRHPLLGLPAELVPAAGPAVPVPTLNLPACPAPLPPRSPLSKTVRFNVLRVIPAGAGSKKGFGAF